MSAAGSGAVLNTVMCFILISSSPCSTGIIFLFWWGNRGSENLNDLIQISICRIRICAGISWSSVNILFFSYFIFPFILPHLSAFVSSSWPFGSSAIKRCHNVCEQIDKSQPVTGRVLLFLLERKTFCFFFSLFLPDLKWFWLPKVQLV